MAKLRFLIGLVVFVLCSGAISKNGDNPFAKSKSVDFSAEWVVKGKTATKSGSDSGTFYHLFYDKKQLRLRMTEGAEDSDSSVKKYEKFAVEDVQIDGKRLPIFQWCLKNQQRHARFLQQGLSVRNNICINEGAKGAFIIRLNVATVESLKKGSKLSFVISPFRSSMKVNFDISDFSTMAGKLGAAPAVAKKPKVIYKKTCEVSPPKGFSEIGSASYECGNEASKAEANAALTIIVNEERKRRKKQAEKARKKELAAKKAKEEKLAAEKAALATSVAQQEAIGSEISNKMIAVCKKKWAAGEHRCYCEKYLSHAPSGIKSDPSCK